jgi:hypothetical protein
MEQFASPNRLGIVWIFDLDPGAFASQFLVRAGRGLGHDPLHVPLADQVEQLLALLLDVIDEKQLSKDLLALNQRSFA